jgi:hypothetical protein
MKYYGMYSDVGNMEVDRIVETARKLDLSWNQVHKLLEILSESSYDRFGEATDTAVREAVYSAVFEMETV